MNAHKLTVLVVDHEGQGAQAAANEIQNRLDIHARVLEAETRDIGEWQDDHPLNKRDTVLETYRELFPSPKPPPSGKIYLTREDVRGLNDEPYETMAAMLEALVTSSEGWTIPQLFNRIRALSHETPPEDSEIVEVDQDETLQCAYCPKILWHDNTWAPGDDPLCCECNREVTGRWKGPSLNPAYDPPPTNEGQ